MPTTATDIAKLQDALRNPGTAQFADPDWLGEVDRLFASHAIERYEVPSKEPGVYGNPGASPGQLKFQKTFFDRQFQFMCAAGSNQSGKTICVGGLCFCKHLRDYAQNGDIYWVIAQTHDATRDIPHKTLWEFLPRNMFPQGVSYQPRTGFGMIPTLHLILPNGRGKCEVWFRVEESELKMFESARLNGAWWTECRREAIWDTIQPRLVARRGFMLMDYISVEAWHKYRLRLKSGDGTKIYWQKMTMPENSHNLAEGSIETACETMTSEQVRIRVYGEEGSDRGVVYQEFDPVNHVCKPFDIPAEWPKWRTFDHGYINPSCCLWVTMVPAGYKFPNGVGSMWDGRIADREIAVVYREFYQSELTVPKIAESIKKLSKWETYRMGGRIVADSAIFARNQSTSGKSRSIAQEFKSHGLAMKKCKKGRGADMHAQVTMVRKWFEENKILFFDICVNAVFEHQAWRYKVKKDGDYSGSEPYVDKDDHSADCFRYLLQERLTYNLPMAENETIAE
jgi:hypothetical protein